MANLSAPPCALNSGHTGKRTTWYSCLLHDTLCSQINCVDVINSIFKSTAIQWITQFILHLESVLHKIQNQTWAQFLCPNSQQLGSTFYSPNDLMTNFTTTVCMLSDLKCLSGYRWHIDLLSWSRDLQYLQCTQGLYIHARHIYLTRTMMVPLLKWLVWVCALASECSWRTVQVVGVNGKHSRNDVKENSNILRKRQPQCWENPTAIEAARHYGIALSPFEKMLQCFLWDKKWSGDALFLNIQRIRLIQLQLLSLVVKF